MDNNRSFLLILIGLLGFGLSAASAYLYFTDGGLAHFLYQEDVNLQKLSHEERQEILRVWGEDVKALATERDSEQQSEQKPFQPQRKSTLNNNSVIQRHAQLKQAAQHSESLQELEALYHKTQARFDAAKEQWLNDRSQLSGFTESLVDFEAFLELANQESSKLSAKEQQQVQSYARKLEEKVLRNFQSANSTFGLALSTEKALFEQTSRVKQAFSSFQNLYSQD